MHLAASINRWRFLFRGAVMHEHYKKSVSGLEFVDVYRVLKLFEVTDPCIQHAVKKLLCAGQRGAKSESQDVQEAIDTLVRYQEMQGEMRGGYAHPLPPSAETPWYPDDSGEWVEFIGNKCPREAIGKELEVLSRSERDNREYEKETLAAAKFIWSNIVAYKVLK